MKKIVLFFLILSSFSIYSWQNREYNWDLFPYIYLTELPVEAKNLDNIHQNSVDLVKKELSQKDRDSILNSSDFRVKMSENSGLFFAQTPFYQPRILYIAAHKFWKIFGLNSIDSVYLTSLVFSLLFLILLYVWISKEFGSALGLFFCIFVAIQPKNIQLSTLATPDMMATFLVLLAVYFFDQKSNIFLYILIGIATVFVRPDKVVLLLAIPFINMLFTRKKLAQNAFAIICLLGSYIFLKKNFYHHSLEFLFSNTFFERIYTLNQDINITFAQYQRIFFKNILPILLISIPVSVYTYFHGYKLKSYLV